MNTSIQVPQKGYDQSYNILNFPINLFFELFIQCSALLIPAFLVLNYGMAASNTFIMAAIMLIAWYSYSLSLLLVSGVIIRLFPKPKSGYIQSKADGLKFQILIALSHFVRRTPAQWLLISPFPGNFFYNLCGSNIAGSASIPSSDSVQDFYMLSVGENTVLGTGSKVICHCAPSPFQQLVGPVKIGDNVMIGAGSIIWANAKIGDGSVVTAQAVVNPGTVIPSNEIWGGIPAKKIKNVSSAPGHK